MRNATTRTTRLRHGVAAIAALALGLGGAIVTAMPAAAETETGSISGAITFANRTPVSSPDVTVFIFDDELGTPDAEWVADPWSFAIDGFSTDELAGGKFKFSELWGSTYWVYVDGGGVYGSSWFTAGAPSKDPAKAFAIGVWSSTNTYVNVNVTIPNVPITAPTPKIKGSAKIGSTLSALAIGWTDGADLTYQWYRDTKAIPKAAKKTYKVTAADVGYRLSVRVGATMAGHDAVIAKPSAKTAKVPPGAFAAPKPGISGVAKVGAVLTASAGSWSPKTVALSYQWFRGTTAIKKATARTYLLTVADFGQQVSVKVSGKLTGYAPTTVQSAKKKVAAGAVTGATPAVKGTVKVGATLSVSLGKWSPATVTKTLKYQWLAGGKAIKGATKATFTVPPTLKGKKVSVKVTVAAPGYVPVSKTSAQKTVK